MKGRRWYLLLGGLLVGAVLFVAIFAEQITPVSPYYTDAPTTSLEGKAPFKPSERHPLGTDQWGRDMWSRVAYGARYSLAIAFMMMTARMLLALPMGLAAAFGPRFVGWLVSRLYVYTSAVPPLLIYLMVLAGPWLRSLGLVPMVIVTVAITTLVEWPRIAVGIKGRLEELSADPFVEGAVAVGATRTQIFLHHLMPHFWPTLLQTTSAEIGRALLTMAQLGIFGVWLGGGITELIVGAGAPQPVNVTGVPEWGTLLAEARTFIRTAPWIPAAPAYAFLVGVAGFHLLSQGMEGISFSLTRWREATTGKLSRRWRWVLVPVVALAGWLYYDSLPSDQRQGVARLQQRQTEALTNRDLPGYLATLDPRDPDYQQEAGRWVASLLETDFEVAVTQPVGQLTGKGRSVEGLWVVSFGYRQKEPVSVRRGVQLLERDGQWYEGRGYLSRLRGFNTDVYASYDPLDPSMDAAWYRFDVRRIATSADRAVTAAHKYFPAETPMERPRVIFYRDHAAYRGALWGQSDITAEQVGEIWYKPGEAIRVSPEIMNPFDPWQIDRLFTYETLKQMARTRLGRTTADPVAMGLYELASDPTLGRAYYPAYGRMIGQPLLTLPELFALPLEALTPDVQPSYLIQAALLVEMLKADHPEATLLAGRESPAALAQTIGLTEADLTLAYHRYLHERLIKETTIIYPDRLEGAKLAVYRTLQEAVKASAGRVSGYQATVMDLQLRDGRVEAHVVEAVAGKSISVLRQLWAEKNGAWVLEHQAGTPLTEGR